MKVEYSDAVNEALENAPDVVKKAFFQSGKTPGNRSIGIKIERSAPLRQCAAYRDNSSKWYDLWHDRDISDRVLARPFG